MQRPRSLGSVVGGGGDRRQRYAGDSVLVIDAMGGVGREAVFTAKSRAVKVWAGGLPTPPEAP